MQALVVKLSSLGDLFHALPAVHCLHEQLHAEIHWVTQIEHLGLVGCFTDVSHAIAYNRRAPFRGFGALWHELRAEEYDLVVDLQGLLKRLLGPLRRSRPSSVFMESLPEINGRL